RIVVGRSGARELRTHDRQFCARADPRAAAPDRLAAAIPPRSRRRLRTRTGCGGEGGTRLRRQASEAGL
ncbi:MAG: hypothetical protein AVDCRST_MAG91-2947, partial [uncultured Sphingomonadaceae bacterium]